MLVKIINVDGMLNYILIYVQYIKDLQYFVI